VLLTIDLIVCTTAESDPDSWKPFIPSAAFPAHLGPTPKAFLNIIHINDIYDVRQSPRCLEKIKKMRDDNTLVFFSGDFMGPSIISDIEMGAQMHPVLAAFNFTFSVLGNHEFDYGEGKFLEVNGMIEKGWNCGPDCTKTVYKTNNKWLLANFKRNKPGKIAGKPASNIPGDAIPWASTTVGGFKVCAIGLVDNAWMEATKLDLNNFTLEDPIETARTMSKKLRTEEECDLIFVLSHMENKSDEALIGDKGSHVDGIEPNDVDFVFGGHDHLYYMRRIGQKVMLKSGMDFEQFSNLKIWWGDKLDKTIVKGTNKDFAYTYNMDENPKDIEFVFSLHRPNRKGEEKYLNVVVTRVNVISEDPRHPDLQTYVKKVIDPKIAQHLLPIIHIQSKLDTREKVMFAGESAILNLFADVGRAYFGGDLAIVNVRMLKGEKVFNHNTFLRRLDFMRLFPYRSDKFVEIEAKGSEILQLLRDAVKFIHRDDKRWIGVSGITFTYQFDPKGDQPAVLDDDSVKVNSDPLDPDKTYKAVTISSMVDNEKVAYNSIFKKTPSTKDIDKIYPIELFDFVSNLFAEQSKEREEEFDFFKKKSCKLMTLDRIAPIRATNKDKKVTLLTKVGRNLATNDETNVSAVSGLMSDLVTVGKGANKEDGSKLPENTIAKGAVAGLVGSIEDQACQRLLENSNADIIRRLRFYSIARGLEHPDTRTILSIDPVSKARMIARDPLITQII
jgi:5'-nucleotidase